jgi:hypothetical protein
MRSLRCDRDRLRNRFDQIAIASAIALDALAVARVILQPSAARLLARISHVAMSAGKPFRWGRISADPDRDRLQKNCQSNFSNDIHRM